MIKRAPLLFLLITSFSILPVLAETLQIRRIPHPELIEVEAASGGDYRLVSQLGGLTYPLSATTVVGGRIEFLHGGTAWRISRADVELVDEKLVVDACGTVPVTLAADARSASVKGAGEGCQ